ncbi:MAG: AEC family transporter [Eubacterium sp.]|jgi:predicted permease
MSLIRPLIYIGIIFLAAGLRRGGYFGERDYRVLSAIFTNVTLPANIVHAFAGFLPALSTYLLAVIGLGFGVVPVFLMYLMRRKHNPVSRAFCMINASGCNIGGFAMPIVQLFYGPQGAVFASVFDLGNAVVMCGGGYALTASLLRLDEDVPRSGLSRVGSFCRKLFGSVSLDAYLILLVLLLCGVPIPKLAGTITEPIANANGFVSMFMLGLMFHIERENKEKITDVKFTVAFRVIFGVSLGLLAYRFLPFPELERKVAAICMVAPAGSISPVFTEQAGADPSLSSFLNSVSVLLSFVLMLVLVYVVF